MRPATPPAWRSAARVPVGAASDPLATIQPWPRAIRLGVLFSGAGLGWGLVFAMARLARMIAG